MLTIQPETSDTIGRDELLALYDAVGWSAYSRSPESLLQGIACSHRVVTARRDDRLVGLARSISDGATIAYIQDILVHPAEQGAHIGTRMTRQFAARLPRPAAAGASHRRRPSAACIL